MAVQPESTPLPEDGWVAARLLPSTGIKGEKERETRATQALLSVMRGVPDFGSKILHLGGGPSGSRLVETYAEVPFSGGEGNACRPDGAAVVRTRGRAPNVRRWLIEVKTGDDQLTAEQVGTYLDIAREQGFDAVLTVSNQITSSPEESPVTLPARRGRPRDSEPQLYHLSWWRILTEAAVLHQHQGIADTDQAWILAELIAYLDDERSGVKPFHDMGRGWTTVRDGAPAERLRANQPEVQEVTERFGQLVEYLGMSLYRDLGRRAEVLHGRGDAASRRSEACAELAGRGTLRAAIKIADTVNPVEIVADLRTRQLATTVDVPAREDRATALPRIRHLLSQLKDTPEAGVDVEALYTYRRAAQATLTDARANPGRLLLEAAPRETPRSFRITLRRPIGRGGGRGGRDSAIDKTRRQLIDFYRDVIQGITPWRPAPAASAAHRSRDPRRRGWASRGGCATARPG